MTIQLQIQIKIQRQNIFAIPEDFTSHITLGNKKVFAPQRTTHPMEQRLLFLTNYIRNSLTAS